MMADELRKTVVHGQAGRGAGTVGGVPIAAAAFLFSARPPHSRDHSRARLTENFG